MELATHTPFVPQGVPPVSKSFDLIVRKRDGLTLLPRIGRKSSGDTSSEKSLLSSLYLPTIAPRPARSGSVRNEDSNPG